jgi:hypothetical protein
MKVGDDPHQPVRQKDNTNPQNNRTRNLRPGDQATLLNGEDGPDQEDNGAGKAKGVEDK